MLTFQEIIARLNQFWAKQNCLTLFPYDVEKGAGTSNPATFLRALGPEPFRVSYVEPCRRPKDGRYALNPNRLQYYFQYQVMLKPSPDNIVDLYLESLTQLGIDTKQHDIRFVHDDWENPTLGASGLGWEIWIDGMEMTQFTYFQTVAGQPLTSIPGEITYGIERIAMCLQKVNSIFDIQWNSELTYGDLFKLSEEKWSKYNFELQDDAMWKRHFEDFRKESLQLLDKHEPIPAYDFVLKSSHAFNMLDAKGVISVSERASYIAAIRELAKRIGEEYVEQRKSLGFPLLKEKPSHLDSSPSPKRQLSIAQQEPGRFLLEIGCEELPASFVPIGIAQLESKMKALLAKEKLTYTSLKAMGTPRRLSVVVENLSRVIPALIEEKKGPSIDRLWDEKGCSTSIGEGFFSSVGLPSSPTYQDIKSNRFSALSIREVKGCEYVYVTRKTPEMSSLAILEERLPPLILSLEFPKMMRWGTSDLLFARPIRWIMSLFDRTPLSFQVGALCSSNETRGHRLLANESILLDHAAQYELVLEKAFVLVDQDSRKNLITSSLKAIESEMQAQALHIEKVLSHVLYLVEYPFVKALPFSKELLDAPKEVIVSEMVEHQKYFPLASEVDGTLLPFFVITAHIPPNEEVRSGNRKVLSARLNDGRFLWQEDCKQGLHALYEKLTSITYQRSLGSLEQKSVRLDDLASKIGPHIGANRMLVEIAAKFAKADLSSNVVGEFPELQGVIGRALALNEKLDPTVAEAIRDHWLPIQEGGPLPITKEGTALALADKLDTLVAFFSLKLIPSSSHDPYALRRQALGIVRIIIEKGLFLPLMPLIHEAKQSLQRMVQQELSKDLGSEVLRFINQRAKIYLSDRYPKELVEAVFAREVEDLVQADAKLKALTLLHTSVEGRGFVEVLKRTLGQIEGHAQTTPTPSLFQDPSEKELFYAIQKASDGAKNAIASYDFIPFLKLVISLQHPLNQFFTAVHVLDENQDLRNNRVGLLWAIFDLVRIVADPKALICIKH